MAICDRCGGEIEFRYVGGSLRPLHVGGVYCPADTNRGAAPAQSKFHKVESYLDPNARCPVCGASVFFYRSPHNGRVFFDDVGWPWPKHPCTDKYNGPDHEIKRSTNSLLRFHFRGRDGKVFDVYVVELVWVQKGDIFVSLKNSDRRQIFDIVIKLADAEGAGITKSDLVEVPSIIIKRDEETSDEKELSFLSARLQTIVVVPAKRV